MSCRLWTTLQVSLYMSFWWYWLSSLVLCSVSVASRVSAVHTVKCFFIVHEVDIKRRITLQGLLQDDTQCVDLVGARPIFTGTSLLLAKLWVYGIFHPVQKNSVKHLSWNGQQCYTSVAGAGAEITFFRELDEVALLPLCWYPRPLPRSYWKEGNRSTFVLMSTFSASAGMLSGPAALPFLSCLIAFWISFVGALQLMGKSLTAGYMSGRSGRGRFV